MPERSEDWINQVQRDLDATTVMTQNGIFEWACFVSQQAAEKAVKAVLQKMNATAWGHSVFDLLRILTKKVSVSDELLD